MPYILWGCPMARDVLSVCDRKLQKNGFMNEEFIHIMEILQNKLEDADLELIAVVACNL